MEKAVPLWRGGLLPFQRSAGEKPCGLLAEHVAHVEAEAAGADGRLLNEPEGGAPVQAQGEGHLHEVVIHPDLAAKTEVEGVADEHGRPGPHIPVEGLDPQRPVEEIVEGLDAHTIFSEGQIGMHAAEFTQRDKSVHGHIVPQHIAHADTELLGYSDTRYKADLSVVSISENEESSSKLQIDLIEFGVGPSLGYQFLAIHDRLVMDFLLFAPRWSVYRLKVKADLQGDGELADELEQAIEDRLGRDLVNTSIDLSTTGTTIVDRNSLGYRYGIKLGYAF